MRTNGDANFYAILHLLLLLFLLFILFILILLALFLKISMRLFFFLVVYFLYVFSLLLKLLLLLFIFIAFYVAYDSDKGKTEYANYHCNDDYRRIIKCLFAHIFHFGLNVGPFVFCVVLLL